MGDYQLELSFIRLVFKDNFDIDCDKVVIMLSTLTRMSRINMARPVKNKVANFYGQKMNALLSNKQMSIIIAKVDENDRQQQIGRIKITTQDIRSIQKKQEFTSENSIMKLVWTGKISKNNSDQLQSEKSLSERYIDDLPEENQVLKRRITTTSSQILLPYTNTQSIVDGKEEIMSHSGKKISQTDHTLGRCHFIQQPKQFIIKHKNSLNSSKSSQVREKINKNINQTIQRNKNIYKTQNTKISTIVNFNQNMNKFLKGALIGSFLGIIVILIVHLHY